MKNQIMALCLLTSLTAFAGREFDDFLKNASDNRLQGLATLLFYKERGITSNFKDADAKIEQISEKARLTGIPEEIQFELSSIKSPVNRSQEQVKILDQYYRKIFVKLPKKKRFFFDAKERRLPESLIS